MAGERGQETSDDAWGKTGGKDIGLEKIWQGMFGSPAKVCGLSIDSRKSKQEEFSVNDTSKLRPELFDFSIERFCRSIG